MGFMIESAAHSTEASSFTLLIPGLQPDSRADRVRVLTQGLAVTFSVAAILLSAHQPLVVTIPAVQCLVRVGEAVIAGGGSGRLDHVHAGLFFLVQLRGLFGENLSRCVCESV